jgi:hypothetical protein
MSKRAGILAIFFKVLGIIIITIGVVLILSGIMICGYQIYYWLRHGEFVGISASIVFDKHYFRGLFKDWIGLRKIYLWILNLIHNLPLSLLLFIGGIIIIGMGKAVKKCGE